jgi:hypothetical protein
VAYDEALGLGRGVVELGTEMATGTAATAFGVGAEAGVALREGEKAGQGVAKNIQEQFTYKPRSKEGKQLESAVGTLTKPIAAGARKFGEFAAGLTGSKATGEVAEAMGPFVVPEAAIRVPGVVGATARAVLPKAKVPAGEEAAATVARDMRARGMVLPPKDIPGAGPVQRNIEGIGGKERTYQLAQQRNQPIANSMVKEEIGIPKDQPIDIHTLKPILDKAGAVYDEVASQPGTIYQTGKFMNLVQKMKDSDFQALADEYPGIAGGSAADKASAVLHDLSRQRFEPAHMVEVVKRLRQRANMNAVKAKVKNDADARALSKLQRGVSDGIEEMIDENWAQSNPGLIQRFQAARKLYAQTMDVARHTDSGGNIRPEKLVQTDTKYPGRLSGNLKRLADMYGHFPKAMHSATNLGGEEGLTVFDTWFGAGELLAGHPVGAAAALARPWVRRRYQFSEGMQRVPGTPSKPKQQRLPPGAVGTFGALTAPTGEAE